MAAAEKESIPPEPDIQSRRTFKRVKGGNQTFCNDASKPVNYGDLVDDGADARNPSMKRTFKQTVMGETLDDISNAGKTHDDEHFEYAAEMFNERIVVEEKRLGKHECPKFTLSKWEEARIQKPWKKGLIVKLLGKKIGYRALENRLNQLWVSTETITIIDLSNDFFLVSFTCDQDREVALRQGPWMIYDHYLTVREWCPNFQPERADIDRVAVWVRFSGLPIEYYDRSFLHFVGNRIGRTVKVDKTTLGRERGKYVRLCVEIDLKKPLLAVFEINNHHYKIEYEGLHFLCLSCGRFGHYKEGCSFVKTDTTNVDQEDNSGKEDNNLWSVVQKTRNGPRKKQGAGRGDTGAIHKQNVGSRFNMLQEQNIDEANPENVEEGVAQMLQNDQKRYPKRYNPVKGDSNITNTGVGKHGHNLVTQLEESAKKDALNKEDSTHIGATTSNNSELQASTSTQGGFTRYEDVVKMDQEGNIIIVTKEIGVHEGHMEIQGTAQTNPCSLETRSPDKHFDSDMHHSPNNDDAFHV